MSARKGMQRAWWLAILCSASVWALAAYAAPTETPDLNPPQRQAINDGVQLEQSHRWLNAIEHYEKSLKDWPASRELEYGLRRSKIHFAIERRYGDATFHRQLLSLSREQSLALFDEVVSTIQGRYVDSLSVSSFVAHGTESLYLALGDEKFVKTNLPGAQPDRIRQLRRTLRDTYWNYPIQQAGGARGTVLRICDLAQAEVGLSGSAAVMEYVFGGCNALDDYSAYLTPGKLNDLYGNIEGQFVGLGIEMRAEAGQGLLLINVLSGSPAEEGGLLPGEHIVGIDSQDCRNMTTDEAASLLQGVEGSRVTLDIQGRPGTASRRKPFSRRSVEVKSIPVARIVDPQRGIAYIQMTGFQKTTATELDAALTRLHREGMRSLIWDVRGNPGGLLTAAVEVCDRFLAEGVMVSTRGRTNDQNFSYGAQRPGTWTMPLVLLTDGDSASASEIVAGAIRDHRRGTLVGRRTYGKWSVQSIFPLTGKAGLRLTTAKFYSPNGENYSKVGVEPHVAVAAASQPRNFYRSPGDIDPATDADLQQGLEVLRKGGEDRSVSGR